MAESRTACNFPTASLVERFARRAAATGRRHAPQLGLQRELADCAAIDLCSSCVTNRANSPSSLNWISAFMRYLRDGGVVGRAEPSRRQRGLLQPCFVVRRSAASTTGRAPVVLSTRRRAPSDRSARLTVAPAPPARRAALRPRAAELHSEFSSPAAPVGLNASRRSSTIVSAAYSSGASPSSPRPWAEAETTVFRPRASLRRAAPFRLRRDPRCSPSAQEGTACNTAMPQHSVVISSRVDAADKPSRRRPSVDHRLAVALCQRLDETIHVPAIDAAQHLPHAASSSSPLPKAIAWSVSDSASRIEPRAACDEAQRGGSAGTVSVCSTRVSAREVSGAMGRN